MLEQILSGRDCIVLDGGLATEAEAQGEDIANELWSASLLLRNPQAIVNAHRAYLEAGAQCLITASYHASRENFMDRGFSADEADQLLLDTVALARQAISDFQSDNPQNSVNYLVAASIGPYAAAALHDGSEYTGEYRVGEAELKEFHHDRLMLLDRGGADILACETIPNFDEVKVLADLLQHVVTPAWISFCCRDDEHLSDGSKAADAAALFKEHPTVFAVGINCTAPKYISSLIRKLRAAAPDKAVVVYPNSGETYDGSDKTWHGTSDAVAAGQAAKTWRDDGATIVGGCCRMGPEHIRAMKSELMR